jgi:hypothetical protein
VNVHGGKIQEFRFRVAIVPTEHGAMLNTLYSRDYKLVDRYKIFMSSNGKGYFCFYVDFVFSSSLTRRLPDWTK